WMKPTAVNITEKSFCNKYDPLINPKKNEMKTSKMHASFEKMREHLKSLSEEDKIRIGSKLAGRIPTQTHNHSTAKKVQ
ncbi:MAG: hypothetical protein ACLFPE_16175, partial [Bacteroidales bacterium]